MSFWERFVSLRMYHVLWTEPLCLTCRLSFVHMITQEERAERPYEARGGLLADTMGTGKSLTLLAVLMHTLDEARIHSCQEMDFYGEKRPRSGATLIIAPKSSISSPHAHSLCKPALIPSFSIV